MHDRSRRRLEVVVLAEGRYLGHVQPAGACLGLAARGHAVTLLDVHVLRADREASWAEGIDAVVARGRSPELLDVLESLEARGMPTLNRRAAIAAVRNKAAMAARLVVAGIPTPRTFAGPPQRLARRVPTACYPLVVKPVHGDNGRGITTVSDARELSVLRWSEPTAVAQQRVPSDGYDLKLYAIGSKIWAVRKPSPLVAGIVANAAEPVAVTPALQALGRRCGELFGLDLFGADCIETPNGAVVIEVNDFPNYTAVPDAGELIAAYVERKLGASG